MAFLFHTINGRLSAGTEYLEAGAITPRVGLALTLTGGKLAPASGAVKPSYICLRESDEAVKAGEIIPVARVMDDTVFETTASAALTSINVGDRVTLSADGMQITATKTDGVAEIVEMDGTAAGDRVRVRFA